MKKTNLFVLILFLTFTLDQFLKILIRLTHFSWHSSILSINLVKNTGASFSLFTNQNSILIFIGLIALGLIFYKIDAILKSKSSIAWALIIGGILGNLTDRIYLGYVVDFVDLYWWPVFNIADSALTIALIMLIFTEIYQHKHKP